MNLRNYAALFISLFLLVLAALSCKDGNGNLKNENGPRNEPLFRLLSPESTGVNFENKLTEGLNTNILMYEYFYNGGGVATGDFNGDDLIDIYFTSNMGENKFYLNLGGLKFEDITLKSGVAGRAGPWKTGANAVDINGDGRLDLYLCYSGALPEDKRKNELYLNMGNDKSNIPVFKESAELYGLASPAFSTQSYFFDYDMDGDLDMLLLNHNPKNLPILNEVKTKALLKIDDPLRGIRLYEQDQGRFLDVTRQAQLSSSELTYGLGIGISDFNNDHWPDFYVSNDYSVPDYLYINQKDGTFKNQLQQSIGHTSQFSMGNDVGDINNDGYSDIITLDMLPEDNKRQKLLLAPDEYSKFDLNVRSGFHYQFMRNMLQLNNGNGTFSEIGQFAGISNTDWSWSALLADYDNDGYRDLFVTNGYYRDYTNLDFINYMNDFVQQRGRLKREDVIQIVNNMPSTDLANYMYKGNGSGQFANVTADWSMDQKAKSNGAAYADLDNDGDLELIVNNINQDAFIYENLTSGGTDNSFLQIKLKGTNQNSMGLGTKINVFSGETSWVYEQFNARGYQSSVSPVIHLGLRKAGLVDSLVVRWPDGKVERIFDVTVNSRITLDQSNAVHSEMLASGLNEELFSMVNVPINYRHEGRISRDYDRQPLLLNEISENGPTLVKGDLTADGLEDIYIGGEAGRPGVIYVQRTDGAFIKNENPEFMADAGSEDCDAVIFDANNDGYPDLYVVSGGYHMFDASDEMLKDRLYINDGSGHFVKKVSALPELRSSNSCVAASDINQDGFTDLFVGGRVIPGRYPENPGSSILINDGKGNFIKNTDESGTDLKNLGMVTDALWADIDQDGVEDLVVVGEWMPVAIFINKGGKLENETDQYLNEAYNGFWNTIVSKDLNGDNLPDFIVGNIGTNMQFQVSEDQPAEMFYADFDRNGSVDPIFCFYIQGVSYPYLTRDELKKQLSSLGSRYPSFESFSSVTVNDLFSQNELEAAQHLTVNNLETGIFMSTPEGKYRWRPLPAEAQYAPVHTISIIDFDEDGNDDLLLCGNDSRLKLRLGKADANYGVLLKGDGSGEFQYIDQKHSGLNITGDVRSVVQIDEIFLFGINQKPMVAYRLNEREKL